MLVVLPSVRCGSSQWTVLSGEAEALSKTSCIPSINRLRGIAAQMIPRDLGHNGVTFRTVNVRVYKRSIPSAG